MILLGTSFKQKESVEPQELQLSFMAQLKVKDRFDLSGLRYIGNQEWVVVADKPYNKFLYYLKQSTDGFEIIKKEALPFKKWKKIDLEGIASCGDDFYLIEERQSKVYRFNAAKTLEEVELKIPRKEHKGKWGNAGFEGIAVDCENKVLYLAKERHPRKIFKVDLQTGVFLDQFDVSDTKGYDFTDLRFQDGYLYALERSSRCIIKIDPESHQMVASVSFASTAKNAGRKLYEPYRYGMAEALDLSDTHIYVGLDNNALGASSYGQSMGLKGTAPVLLVFKRPAGF